MPARVDCNVGEDEEAQPPTLELGGDRRALLLSVEGLRAEPPTTRPAVISNGPSNGAGGVVRDAFGDCYRPMERAWLIVEESTDEGLEKEQKAAARAAERQKKQRLQGVRGLSKRTVSKRPKVKAGWHGEPCGSAVGGP
eukprot:2566090-Prymnesium_polylepis.1